MDPGADKGMSETASRHWANFRTHLLRLLCNHEDEREVVHAERVIEQLVGVAEEDDVLDRVFRSFRVLGCRDKATSVDCPDPHELD